MRMVVPLVFILLGLMAIVPSIASASDGREYYNEPGSSLSQQS